MDRNVVNLLIAFAVMVVMALAQFFIVRRAGGRGGLVLPTVSLVFTFALGLCSLLGVPLPVRVSGSSSDIASSALTVTLFCVYTVGLLRLRRRYRDAEREQ